MNCLLQHPEAVIEVDRPECLAEFSEGVPPPHVIDQNVEPLVPPSDSGDQLFHFGRLGVIHSYAMPRPPATVTSSAVSSIVSGRPGVAGCRRELQPVQ